MSAGCRRSPIAKHNIDETKVMPTKISLIGRTFGKLKVIADAPSFIQDSGRIRTRSYAVCECGAKITAMNALLKSGHTKSCGCHRYKMVSDAQKTHGHTLNKKHSPTYQSWSCMIQRCTNPNIKKWSHYGGRGITACDRWLKFENFLADMGERPTGKSLDRINNDGNYEPSNCRWATHSEQMKNRGKFQRIIPQAH